MEVVKDLQVPVLLTGLSLSIKNEPGFPFSSMDVKHFARTNFPRFHTNLDNSLQFAPAYAVAGLNVIGVKGKNNWVDELILYGLSIGIQSLIVRQLKISTHVLRPDSSDYSAYPSGHTSTAFTAATFMYMEYRDRSPWYGIAAYTTASVVGAMRILNNRHWASDVLAGAAIGIVVTRIVYLGYPRVKKCFRWNSR